MSPSEPPALDAHLGYWLRGVSNAVSSRFARALAAEQVSTGEWVTLRLLHGRETATSGDLALRTGMTRGAVSKIVDKLEVKGLVTRTPNPGDGRIQWVSLTRKGRHLVPVLASLADQNDAHFFGCLTAKERTDLRRLLEKLTDHHRLSDVPVE